MGFSLNQCPIFHANFSGDEKLSSRTETLWDPTILTLPLQLACHEYTFLKAPRRAEISTNRCMLCFDKHRPKVTSVVVQIFGRHPSDIRLVPVWKLSCWVVSRVKLDALNAYHVTFSTCPFFDSTGHALTLASPRVLLLPHALHLHFYIAICQRLLPALVLIESLRIFSVKRQRLDHDPVSPFTRCHRRPSCNRSFRYRLMTLVSPLLYPSWVNVRVVMTVFVGLAPVFEATLEVPLEGSQPLRLQNFQKHTLLPFPIRCTC